MSIIVFKHRVGEGIETSVIKIIPNPLGKYSHLQEDEFGVDYLELSEIDRVEVERIMSGVKSNFLERLLARAFHAGVRASFRIDELKEIEQRVKLGKVLRRPSENA